MISKFKKTISRMVQPIPNLQKFVIELNSIDELKKLFKWEYDPIINDLSVYECKSIEDVNERRLRDALSLGTVMRNANPKISLEIGTALGNSTALMAENAPKAHIYTVNILPEQIEAGTGGVLTTHAFAKEQIGQYYKAKNLSNITQIFANTAIWEPDIGVIDVAYIDGCHDAEFVYNDTRKILKHAKPGSFILWHDFNLELVTKYHWINSVCTGVEKLYEKGYLKGRIVHLRDSWIGIYRVEK